MSNEGSKGSESSSEWANLTPDCLLEVFSKLTVDEMLDGPMQVCKPWSKSGNMAVYSAFDFGTRTAPLPASGEFDWDAMEEKMDALLQAFVDRSEGGLKSIKIKLCTDKSISYVADNCPDLVVLWLTSCPSVTDASILKIASNCKKLKEVCVRSSGGITW
ncbi:PREDICTED: putative F-box/LRR-repeat protein 19 [Camelina sativa]|uniref:F-box/LRR-repeat protein 19 n=1 Tax=Camelina sativa TaxID=90675 RepID=A0ABM0TXR5_CAMSA|nr:PREDICTED: putative F-box/LRR-repeat protein 19 [Camelina sativa]